MTQQNPWERPVEPIVAPETTQVEDIVEAEIVESTPQLPAPPRFLPDVDTAGQDEFSEPTATDEGMPEAVAVDAVAATPVPADLDLGQPANPVIAGTDFAVAADVATHHRPAPTPLEAPAADHSTGPIDLDLPPLPEVAPGYPPVAPGPSAGTGQPPASGQTAYPIPGSYAQPPLSQPASGQPPMGYPSQQQPNGAPSSPPQQPYGAPSSPPQQPYGAPSSPPPAYAPTPYGAPGAFVPGSGYADPSAQAPWAQPSGMPYQQPGFDPNAQLAHPYQQPGYPGASGLSQADENLWASVAHWLAIPLSLIGPVIVLATQGDKSPRVRAAAVESLNFQLTLLIGIVVSVILAFVLVGILTMMVIGVLALVMPIIAALSENRGQPYRYPFNIRMIK